MSYFGTKINPKYHHRSQIKFYLFVLPLAIFMVLPIIYIFVTAFKPIDELFAFPPRFYVINPTLDNFRDLAYMSDSSGLPMGRYILNSILVTGFVLVLSLLFSTMAGFALSKKHFKGKSLLFEINTLAIMFVPIAVTIPRFLIISKLGIINTFSAHILPLLAVPVGLFLVKQFIDQIPNELIEAAYVDGANDFYIYKKIIIPLIKPAIATVAILAFQSTWNNVETSTLFVNNSELKTFAFYLNTFVTQSNAVAGAGIAAASSMIMFLPNLIIFIFLQSKIMNTMAHSGIK
ncbi:carbohydrate ABC transporter permease [Mycoplasmatota bacterium]|nr:carbohydrate ABC transporter permease [Mycoplasmatota bacterium]